MTPASYSGTRSVWLGLIRKVEPVRSSSFEISEERGGERADVKTELPKASDTDPTGCSSWSIGHVVDM